MTEQLSVPLATAAAVGEALEVAIGDILYLANKTNELPRFQGTVDRLSEAITLLPTAGESGEVVRCGLEAANGFFSGITPDKNTMSAEECQTAEAHIAESVEKALAALPALSQQRAITEEQIGFMEWAVSDFFEHNRGQHEPTEGWARFLAEAVNDHLATLPTAPKQEG